MKLLQRSVGQIIILLLSLAGIAITVYLTTVHYENVPLICSSHGVVDCGLVLASSYSVVPGTTIPITIPGLCWCLASAALAIIGWRFVAQRRWINALQFIWSLAGLLAVLYLVYAEIVRLHTICAWCTALHVIILIIFLITLLQLQQARAEEPEESGTLLDEEPALTTMRNQT
jgi:uncharacterized membrane protein